jgi:hypothetical protein
MLGVVQPGVKAFDKPVFLEVEDPLEGADDLSPFVLVWDDGAFRLLEMMNVEGRHREADYYRSPEVGKAPEEMDAFRIWKDQGRALPADGNSLINGLSVIMCGQLPSDQEILRVRERVQRLLADKPDRPLAAGPAVPWACSTCTLLNSPSASDCAACAMPRR